MTSILIRAETRKNEKRVGITPIGAKKLIEKGIKVSIEESKERIIPTSDFHKVGCEVVRENSWSKVPSDTIIFGLKELPEYPFKLEHRHIMFGHAYKCQPSAENLLKRFKLGGGVLYDIEYLFNSKGKRVAAFGYWAGYIGAAVSISCWISQKVNKSPKKLSIYKNKNILDNQIKTELQNSDFKPKNAIVIGALGRVGRGVIDFCEKVNIRTTKWDILQTFGKSRFPEILNHDLFFNCILASNKTPTFISNNDIKSNQRLSVIGDISCDPGSKYNPIDIYNYVTNWKEPVVKISKNPILEVMAIDNLPSLLPLESSYDFANQLLPYLMNIDRIDKGIWLNAHKIYFDNVRLV